MQVCFPPLTYLQVRFPPVFYRVAWPTFTERASLCAQPTGRTQMVSVCGNEFKVQPLSLFQLTDKTGNADAIRVTTADGVASGTVASADTSTYMSGNQFKVQPLNQYQITDRTGNADSTCIFVSWSPRSTFH